MSSKLRAGQKIKLKSVEELLGVTNEESALDIEIAKIRPFKDHPFKVLDDEKMQDLVESVRANGILSPVLIRPVGFDRYEMVSGHRRMHAAKVLGLERVPAIIRDMSDDEAVVRMVDSNIQREELLPSEKAFAYKMKMDAVRRGAGRPNKENLSQIGTNYRADQELADQVISKKWCSGTGQKRSPHLRACPNSISFEPSRRPSVANAFLYRESFWRAILTNQSFGVFIL